MHEGRATLWRKGTYGQELPKRPEELSASHTIHPRLSPPRQSTAVPITPAESIDRSPGNTTESTIENAEDPEDPGHLEDIEDPFAPSEPSLLIVQASIAGVHSRVLTDDGAQLNHISEAFCDRHGISLKTGHHRPLWLTTQPKNSSQPSTLSQ